MKRERNLYVVYDIKDNDTRQNLANILMYYGLHRIQYSVFYGPVSLKDKYKLIEEIDGLEIEYGDKIHILDLCEKCLNRIVISGKVKEEKEHLVI